MANILNKTLRVLFVEDAEDDVVLILRLLRKSGYDSDYQRVESAAAMRDALLGRTWDVIIVDNRLPDFSGIEAINLLKTTGLDIPLIIVSGDIQEEMAVECMRLGARDYLRKENLSRLAPAIEREITEVRIRDARKQAEEQLRRSEENYRIITETTYDFIATSDLNWTVTYGNKAVRDWLGMDPVGLNIIDFTPPELRAEQQTMMRKRREGYRDVLCFEWEAVDLRGRKLILDVQSQLLTENGAPAGVLFIARNITDRKIALEALKESEDKYRLVVENAREGIVVAQDEKLAFVNRRAVQMTGYSDRRILALPFVQFIHPDDRDDVLSKHVRRLNGEDLPSVYTFRIIDARGQTRWVEIKTTLIPWKGKPATLNFLTDITDRMASEEAVKHLVGRFDLAVHAARLGVWDRDIPGDQMIWNDRMYELYGVSKEDFAMTHENWIRTLHPDDVEQTLREMKKALEGELDYHTEFRIIHPDGTLKHIRTYGKVTRDAAGNPLRMTGINYDITERKQAENRLRESEFRYRSLFTEIREGFALHEILCDGNGTPVDYRFLDINPAFEKLTGLSADRTIGKSVRELLPQTESRWIETYGKVALTGQPVTFENYAKEFDRYYHVNAFCPQKGQFATLFTDITDRKKMEAQLSQAQKMEAIGTLAGGIAHDFNNILGAIMGYAGMAQDELPEGSSAGDCLDQIFRASERAKNLVGQILAFSRRSETASKPLVVVPAVKEIIKLLRATLPSTILIRQDIQINDAAILADPTQVHQVLMNLCTNAAYAMREKGGTLTIGLKQLTVGENDNPLSRHLQAGPYLEIRVADDGPGIAETIQPLIFDPFFTTKKTGEGTGMGLAVVHGIVKSYGGHIGLESHRGEGTTFFVYLPLLTEAGVEDDADKASAAVGGKERILLVDDQDFMLEMMSRSLSRLGYQVTAEGSSEVALDLFKSDPAAFDLVITDQTMPYLTGADMARDMLKTREDIPIILCTGFSATVSQEQAKAMGIREYVMKPVAMNEFARLIRTVLAQNGS